MPETMEVMTGIEPSQITDLQRDRAVDYLQQAYAKGVLDETAFEDRLARALTAVTRAELNSSLRGIARIPQTGLAIAPTALPPVPAGVQNVGAGMVHLLGIPTGFVGPAIVKAISPRGSRVWLEAGRAMSWQIFSLLAFIAIIVGSLLLGLEMPIFIAWLAWLGASAVFAVRAFNGQPSTGALGELLPFRPK